ncbi:minichromosome maintenance protein MCM [soil metagenome]
MGRWDKEGSNNNEGDKDKDKDKDKNEGWVPKHRLQWQDNKGKVLSVSEASRLHEGKNISVKGIISGIQPLRKMIKGLSVQCIKCYTEFQRTYDKPELFESSEPVDRIRKCPKCKTGDYLDRYKQEIVNAVVVELKDHDTFSEIDPLRIIVFGDDEPAFDNTRNIEKHVGEPVIVTGDIYNVAIGRSQSSRIWVTYLYVKYLIKYLSKQEVDLSTQDVNTIKRFVSRVGSDKVIDNMANMFAPDIIGYNVVKKGLLLCAASTGLDKTEKKIHVILVGDPGLAKSLLLKRVTKLVPNSRYESVQFATGKSLTAIVTKEEGDAHILRIGPIPQAKGAIAALNEVGRMIQSDQGFLLDTMQEQEFTTNKYGLNFHVDAPTAIVASANPTGGSWKSGFGYNDENGDSSGDDNKFDLDKIPMIKPLIDRFDLIFTSRTNRDKNSLAEYAQKKSEMEGKRVVVPDYLIKHILYARLCPKPKFSKEAENMLNEYYASIAEKYGSPRIRETVIRIAMTIAKLKLKKVVDIEDAKETMQFYNVILLQLDMIVALPTNPRDVVYEVCLGVLRESKWPISFEDIVKSACDRNQQVRHYIGHTFELSQNHKLRPIREMLENHSRIKIVKNTPLVFKYMHTHEEEQEKKTSENDQYDVNDVPFLTPTK